MKNLTLSKFITLKALLFIFIIISIGAGAQTDTSLASADLSKIAIASTNEKWINIRADINITAQAFVTNYKAALGLGANDELRLTKKETDDLSFTHYRYQQHYKGFRIVSGDFTVHEKAARVNSANGLLVKGLSQNTTVSISKPQAIDVARRLYGAGKYAWEVPQLEENRKNIFHNKDATYYPTGELVWVSSNDNDLKDAGAYRLAYMLDMYDAGLDGYRMFIDASSGLLIKKYPLVAHCQASNISSNFNGSRTIYTKLTSSNPLNYQMYDDCQTAYIHTRKWNAAGNHTEYNSSTNTWTSVSSAASTHWAIRQVYNYYAGIHSRSGWNGANAGVDIYQDALFCYTQGCTPSSPSNASFGGGVMLVGNNGNTDVIDDWNSADIIGHEFTHGVTESSAGLIYSKESGALNESFSDIFGATFYAWIDGLDADKWRVGFDRKNPSNTSVSLYIRNMSNPNDKGDPDTYKGTNWVNTTSVNDPGDGWGVHTNSGVQNYMYFLLVSGGSGTNDNGHAFSISGIGITKARAIAYRALTVGYLDENSTYADARNAWVHAAADLHGACSNEAVQTGKAWDAVGLAPPSVSTIVCGSYGTNSTTYYNYGGTLNVAGSCNVTVSGPNNVFFSGKAVIMKPGFVAQTGSSFAAYINECEFATY